MGEKRMEQRLKIAFSKSQIEIVNGHSAIEERFWSKVGKADGDGCWLWIGNKTTKGYGKFFFDKKTRQAHRVCWELT